MNELEKAAKECGLTTDFAKEIVVAHHELKNLVKKKSLVTMKIDLSDDAEKKLKKICKTLKVDAAAVLCAVVEREIASAPRAGTSVAPSTRTKS